VFLRRAWYVAAWDRDITRKLTPLTILDERIVLYRTTTDQVVALEDACPHRKLPLSMGRLQGDKVECGYHGLTFDATGACTRVPCSEYIPKGARVQSYPVVSRYGLVWIWMGPPELADPATIFPVEHWGEPGWGTNSGDAMSVDAHYLFVTDNLLDPSHVAWVHRESFGNAACESEPVTVQATAEGIIAARWMRRAEVAPFYAPFLKFNGACDRLQHYEVRFPSHAIIKAVIVPAGSGGPDADRHPQAFIMDSYNFMTPVDADQTRYYWFQMRNFAPDDPAVSEQMTDSVRSIFKEDQAILKAVHRGFKNMRTPNIDIAIDSAPLRFRRRLSQLIAAERSTQSPEAAIASTALPT
jgi:phenylpropionate dioxygenase-like ring-hydroxylating dioxygenase large terminal subunit